MSDAYKMTAPTKLDRTPPCRLYMLLSYSHADGPILDTLFNELYKKGSNYWYDIEMHVGNSWKERVLNNLKEENGCCGVVFFISADYLLSDSCGWELEQFLAKKEKNENYHAYVVLKDYTSDEEKDPLAALYAEAKKKFIEMMMKGTADSTATMDKNKESLSKILKIEEKKIENLFLVLKEENLKEVCENLYDGVFKTNNCTANLNEALSDYARNQGWDTDIERKYDKDGNCITKKHYKITFGTIVNEKQDKGSWKTIGSCRAVWIIFNLRGKNISLLLKSKPMGTCGRILAKNKLDALQSDYILYEDRENRKRLAFTEEEQARLVDIRFLFKEARENEKLADDINWALSGDYDPRVDTFKDYDPEANGYFFVMANSNDNRKQFYYADRFSTSVYENVWRDEIASVVPVIDIKASKE